MSKVALRVYNRDIEALIDQGHLDEAIAHCQHVLKTFPKYLESYRLLGKAYLEARRFSDAADIFQRVLLAVPDDFISHLGMSIVSDEQRDLDRAIWHMERAYEISPSNAGVQNELRRLYGRRDGLEPPKIRLTRGALAQMYTKGGQYQQAIVEIKSVLAEDPTRNDMKILLARAYFRAGMKVEATEICTELLRQYPYSLDANRILVDILPGTSLAGSVEQYKKRVQALDPYAALVTGSLFEVDSVPDAAVSIDRLEYDVSIQQTGWQSAVEIPVAPGIQPSTENLPDWMQQAGWGPSTGEFQEGQINFDEPELSSDESPVTGLVEAELPDWLKAMAPPSASVPQPAADEALAAEDLDWLAGLGGPLAEGASAKSETQPAAAEPAPDWTQDSGQAITDAAAALSVGVAATEEDLDWLGSLSTPQDDKPVEPQEFSPADLPDWLKGTGESQKSPAAELSADWLGNLAEPTDATLTQPEPVADWLKDLTPVAEEQPLSAPVSGPGTSEAEQDEALKWLESLAVKQGAKPEELLTKPEERIDELPDWVGQVGETPVQPVPTTPEPYIPEKPIEVEAEPFQGELSPVSKAPGTGPLEQDDAMKWLESLAEKQGAKPEELITSPSDRTHAAPAWLSDVQNPPTALSALVSGPGTSEAEQDDALKWLESLAAKQGAKPEELITKPEERHEELPDWVAKVGEEPVGAQPPAESLPWEMAAEIPAQEESTSVVDDWLSSLEQSPQQSSTPMPWEQETPIEPVAETPAEPLPWETPAQPVVQPPAAQIPVESFPWESGPEELPAEPLPWETPAQPVAEPPVAQIPAESFPWEIAAQETPTEPLPWETPVQPVVEPPAAQIPVESFPWESAPEELPAEPLPWETPAQPVVEPPVAQTPAEALPWESEAEEMPAEPLPWETPLAETPAVETPTAASADVVNNVSAWLESLDEQPPAISETPLPAETEELPDWLKEMSADEEVPTPVPVSDWIPVEESPTSQEVVVETATPAQAEQKSEAAPQAPLRLRSTDSLQDKDASFINLARQLLDKGSLEEAMNSYTNLIKKGKLLEEVIEDLNEIVYRHPVDVIVWQTMGDAYMRSNRLQEALDAYTKAEELLRR